MFVMQFYSNKPLSLNMKRKRGEDPKDLFQRPNQYQPQMNTLEVEYVFTAFYSIIFGTILH